MAPKLNGLPPHLQPHQIDPIVQVKPNSDPSAVSPHPDVSWMSTDWPFDDKIIQALYEFVKPIVDLKFEAIKLSDSTFVDIIDKLNVKRKFLFDKRLKVWINVT